jgi:DNA-binding SARP family transcriptional activator/Tfp pilus assembly protein PilF
MLRIKALGCLAVVGPDGPVAGAAAQPRRLAILALLARAGERGVTRDKILGYLYPDTEEDRARRTLANAIYALRRDLGSDESLLGGNDLRLNPDVVSCDVVEFDAALAAGELARAASLYEGPFLDGFRLAGAPEFERWADAQRSALDHAYVGAVGKLARNADAAGRHEEASGWWRKLTASDPLNARYAVGLMQALVALGDRAGALRHARIYETLVEQELDLPPDRAVVDLAQRLREDTAQQGAGAPPETNAITAPAPTHNQIHATDIPPAREPRADTSPPHRARSLTAIVASAVVGAAIVATAFLTMRGESRGTSDSVPVLALGRLADYREDRSTELVKPLTDMLATALARSPAFRVVSTARLYDLTARATAQSGTATDGVVAAARTAGATELLEGALYVVDDTTLRLDVRRIDLATGNVRAAHSVSARTPFALADSATARILGDVGAAPPAGSIADVTTRSLTAYRFYEEGLRAYFQDDLAAAERLFTAAVADDTTFASAAYYLALSVRHDDQRPTLPMLERAVRLASHAGDRERLTIQARWDLATSSPRLRVSAESLLVRFPEEVEGPLFTGIVRVADGRFLDAVPHLQRAISMDSLSLVGARAECHACEAFRWLIAAYQHADSLALAEREVRRWMTLQPRSGLFYASLVDVLSDQGRVQEAIAAWRERSRMAPGQQMDEDVVTRMQIKAGAYREADELMRSVLATGSAIRRSEALWLVVLSERNQGRLSAALASAREEHRLTRTARPEAEPPLGGIAEAQVLLELGRGRESAAIYDAIARWQPRTLVPSDSATGVAGRRRAWHLTHAANGLAAVGDTVGLAARADTIQREGARSAYRLHRELHHHVRGLLLVARGQDDAAVGEFRQALDSPTRGYTRTNFELGRALMRLGRFAEAVSVLQPALRGGVEAANYYVTAPELHELLAQAWDTLSSDAGRRSVAAALPTASAARDSARVHYEWVARAWASGDPPFAARAAKARARVTALGNGRSR